MTPKHMPKSLKKLRLPSSKPSAVNMKLTHSSIVVVHLPAQTPTRGKTTARVAKMTSSPTGKILPAGINSAVWYANVLAMSVGKPTNALV
jgi:hypothetical protein